MTTYIECLTNPIIDYVHNLIAGRKPISDLYVAVDRARDQRSQGKQFCYYVTFKGIGCKTYKASQLIQLDDCASKCSTTYLINEYKSSPTLDNFIKLLLNARIEILKLYQTRYRAQYIKSSAKKFTYTFTNPFGSAANVDTNTLSFDSATVFLSFFCMGESYEHFEPLAIVPIC
jgi:hypothetical protein